MSIEVKNLLKQYGEQKAVNTISFKVEKGEIVGFLGPNGAGKSTTMKIITGYLQQTSGEAFVCGINVAEQPLETKKKIGYLPELNALYYDMYVREYLAFVAEVHQIPIKSRTDLKGSIATQMPHLAKGRKDRIEEVIEIVGLKAEANKKIGQLSKGYKQRVGLAAAFIHDPEVLILDEPTSGLDPNQIVEIREVIRKQGQNKTVLFSSHILQEVEAICDRVIIINKGNLVANDKLSSLQKKDGTVQVVIVQLDKATDKNIFSAIPGVSNVEELQNSTYRLQTQQPDAVRKHIMQIALQQNLNIVSLQSDSQKLEDVFKSLTS